MQYHRIVLEKFECIGRGRSAWCTKLNSALADSETPRRLLHGTYVLHRPGCSQADDQLLREGRQWQDSRRGIDSGYPFGSGSLAKNTPTAMECSDGSYVIQRLDLRSPQTACCRPEGGAPPDVAGHRRGEKEERSHRCQQDLRL